MGHLTPLCGNSIRNNKDIVLYTCVLPDPKIKS